MSHFGRDHEYQPEKYSRDDLGFYTRCVLPGCDHLHTVEAVTEREYWEYWGIYDDDDWKDDDEEHDDDYDYQPNHYYR